MQQISEVYNKIHSVIHSMTTEVVKFVHSDITKMPTENVLKSVICVKLGVTLMEIA